MKSLWPEEVLSRKGRGKEADSKGKAGRAETDLGCRTVPLALVQSA